MVFVGVDVARASHQFCVLSDSRQVVQRGKLENKARAIEDWCREVTTSHGTHVVVGIETPGGLSTTLGKIMASQQGWSVHQVLPERVKVYREVVLRIHSKTDETDAFATAMLLADAPQGCREVHQPRLALREATRWRQRLVDDKTRNFNLLRKTLAAYWPEADTGLFEDLGCQYALALFSHMPDPAVIAQAGVEGLRAFFRERRSTVSTKKVESIVLAARAARPLGPGYETSLYLLQARQLAQLLSQLNDMISHVERVIGDLAKEDADVQALHSKKGIGTIQVASFVAEMQAFERFENEAHLASYAGVALCSVQTGKTKNFQRRQWRSNRRLQRTLMSMAETLCLHDATSKAFYKKKVSQGHDHNQALRALGRHLVRAYYGLLKRRRRQTART